MARNASYGRRHACDDGIVEGGVVATKIMESLGPRLDRWRVESNLDIGGRWVITLAHPASAGLVLDTGSPNEGDAIAVGNRIVAANTEIDIASAAPDLEHADLILGLRTISKMFEWDNREVRVVAFLMFEHGQLNLDETAWLSGYEGINAPMKAASPLG
jgi:hypothetical protein